jgi:hypothetical protein
VMLPGVMLLFPGVMEQLPGVVLVLPWVLKQLTGVVRPFVPSSQSLLSSPASVKFHGTLVFDFHKVKVVNSYRKCYLLYVFILKAKKTPWPESTSELYRPSDHWLSAKSVPTFADRGATWSAF